MKDLKLTIDELLSLPKKGHLASYLYSSILLVPCKEKHEASGYQLIAVVGVDKNGNPVEIAAICDDIEWRVPKKTDYGLRTDMIYPLGIVHFWSNQFYFRIGHSTSTCEIYLIPTYRGIRE
jgi:hypothetical protein